MSPWEKEYFSKGFAVCEHSIIDDRTFCRFRNETFLFDNGGDIDHLILGKGPYSDRKRTMLHAKVSKLRTLKKRSANG